MSVVPEKPIDKVQFYEDHNDPWSTNAVALGTTAAAVTALQTKTEAARAAYSAQQVALAAAKTATNTFNNAVQAMALAGSAIIDQIRAAAKTSGPDVYDLAMIPPPATPSAKPAPGEPYKFTATLDKSGALLLTWKCDNPRRAGGTMYQLWRQIGEGELQYIGGCGSKQFTDNTVPAGTSVLTYQMQAVRSTAIGPWATFVVKIGQNGTTVTPLQPKIAA